MNNSLLIALVGGGIALLVFMRRASGAQYERLTEADNLADDVQIAKDDPYWFLEDAPYVESVSMSPDQNVLAFLALIRKFETNDRYDIIYGGETFDMNGPHPRIKVPINLPGYEGKFSTATGGYQFNWPTWSETANETGLWTMQPANQDANAIHLLNKIGALQYIEAGNFDQALRIASKRWASLPYSTAKQNPKSVAAANEFLTRYLG